MPHEVRVEILNAVPLAGLVDRWKGNDRSVLVPELCGRVWRLVRELEIPGAGRLVAVYHPDGTLTVGAELAEPMADRGGLLGVSTPTGEAASVTHFGPYGLLGTAHEAVRTWAAANGRRLAGPNWEVYGHWQDAWNQDPSLIETEVRYLLAPRQSTGLRQDRRS